ncbi:SPC25 domain-containing protein [Ceratobasidium theobromae]|uniref:Signal peptidase complex subunit 2 n=1 Tax=Ceratobasidium theobromae TaxID=1582974 RepID=A0A5N5QGW9_9AGAM|nr:SPC25 domain-containing protein [Ceratobasidium theobromae]
MSNNTSDAAPPKVDEIKANNSNLTELKFTCDDALRKHLSRPEHFKQLHTHTDVRLGLGYASVAIAAATGLYSWKKDFEESKQMIETERLTIGAKTKPSEKKNFSAGPRYSLTATYVHTANNGKSLIRKSKESIEAPFTIWFDEEGKMDEVAFNEWLNGFVGKLVGESS